MNGSNEQEQGASANADRSASLRTGRLICTSTHCERRQECASPSECTGSPRSTQAYRGWSVHYDNPPIPLRSMDWSATSPDYDVDCDDDGFHVCAGQQAHAATYDALIEEIDAAIEGAE